jgi:alkaline phosphatase D
MTPRRSIATGVTRRGLLRRSALAGGALAAGTLLPARGFAQQGPAMITSDKMRPVLPSGVQSGDLAGDRAILWAQTDRPARMMVDWATTESLGDAKTVSGPAALEEGDFTAKLDLAGLPAGQRIHYRVRFFDLADHTLASEPVAGSFWTPPAARRNLRFVWSGDTAGQGWGINQDWGGMKIYEAMRAVEPAFLIHSGDTIYADGPISAEQAMPEGGPRSRRWPRRSPSFAATTPTT